MPLWRVFTDIQLVLLPFLEIQLLIKIYKMPLHFGSRYFYWHRRKTSSYCIISALSVRLKQYNLYREITPRLPREVQMAALAECCIHTRLDFLSSAWTVSNSSFLTDANHVTSLERVKFTWRCNRFNAIKPKPSRLQKRELEILTSL